MSRNSAVLVGSAATLFLLSCNQSFDSRAPFQQQLVVFSVLSTDRIAQFVRVEGDYIAVGYDPLSSTSDNVIRGASVKVKDGATTYRLRDTLMTRQDTSRYNSPLHAFVLNPFAVQPGKTFVVTVQAPGFTAASATATIPGKGFPGTGVTTSLILDNPRGCDENADIICKLIFNRMVFQFLQADKNLFDYFNTRHAFRDARITIKEGHC